MASKKRLLVRIATLLAIAAPVALLTWVWLGDVRWAWTGLISAGCAAVIGIVAAESTDTSEATSPSTPQEKP